MIKTDEASLSICFGVKVRLWCHQVSEYRGCDAMVVPVLLSRIRGVVMGALVMLTVFDFNSFQVEINHTAEFRQLKCQM